MFRRNEQSLHNLKNGQNDWDGIPYDKLEPLQKVAKKTNGIVTLGNFITAASTVCVMDGLYDFVNGRRLLGMAKVAVGRIGDLIDGWGANKTRTKGRKGRDFDAGVDGVQSLTAGIVLEAAGVLPLPVAAAVVAPKAVDTVATIAAKLRHREMNATEGGKNRMFIIWGGAIGSFMLKAAVDKYVPGYVDFLLETTGYTAAAGNLLLGATSTVEYVKIGLGAGSAETSAE